MKINNNEKSIEIPIWLIWLAIILFIALVLDIENLQYNLAGIVKLIVAGSFILFMSMSTINKLVITVTYKK